MVVLAGTLVLSVDTVAPSIQFPDNAVTKTALSKAQSRQSFLSFVYTAHLRTVPLQSSCVPPTLPPYLCYSKSLFFTILSELSFCYDTEILSIIM